MGEYVLSAPFAFMIHPLDIHDVARKFPLAAKLPERLVEGLTRHLPPMVISHITGIQSDYNEAEGWFVSCPLLTRQMKTYREDFVKKKLLAAGKKAEELGAKILGLGAYTAIVGAEGRWLAEQLNIGVTTGNSYTAATAIEAARKAAEFMDIDLAASELAIVGATGSIGRACAILMANDCRQLTLVGRDMQKLERLGEEIIRVTNKTPRLSTQLHEALPRADVVIAVSSAVDAIINPEDLKPGAVVCDVARPRDVSHLVAEQRPDVLVIEGGVVEVPGDVNFNFNFGLPPRMAMACMAETMMLALEERFEDYTLGREYDVEKIEETMRMAEKHGFRLAGFRSFERMLTNEQLEATRQQARLRKAQAQ